MKFTVSQQTLAHHLALVSRVVPSRPSHPVLGNVLLVAEPNSSISLTGFDLSIGVKTSFAVDNAVFEVYKNGSLDSLAIPGKLISDYVSKLPQQDITFKAEKSELGGWDITLTCGKSEMSFRGLDSEDYPELPTVAEEPFTVPSAALLEGFANTLFCVSTDQTKQILQGTKQILQGVHLSTNSNGCLEFAATDGHRLAISSTTTILELAPTTIPGNAAREIAKLADKGDVLIAEEPGQLVAKGESQEIVTRLLEGQYPNYAQLVPKQFSKSVKIDRKLLLSAIGRISVLADEKSGVIKFSFADNQLTLAVDAQDRGKGREVLPCELQGDAIDLAFNGKYVVDGLQAIQNDTVEIYMNAPTSPVLFHPNGCKSFTCLVMPVQIRSN